MKKNIYEIWQFLPCIISALSGLIGVFVGAWLYSSQSQRQRKLDFCEKQLKEFYSPLVGIRKEIQILSEFRCDVERASEERWQEVCKVGDQMKPSEAQKYRNGNDKCIDGPIEYEDEQFEIKILPAYRKLVETFKNNSYLAEEETREFLPTLIKFVDLWERNLSKTHSREVIKKINFSEKELLPFYKHLEEKCSLLREKIKKGNI